MPHSSYPWTMTSVSDRVRKRVAMACQFSPELLVIVDLAIEDDSYTAVLVAHRLRAGRQIENGQPPMPEHHIGRHANASGVRTPMHQGIRHPSDALMKQGVDAAGSGHGHYPAHGDNSSGVWRPE